MATQNHKLPERPRWRELLDLAGAASNLSAGDCLIVDISKVAFMPTFFLPAMCCLRRSLAIRESALLVDKAAQAPTSRYLSRMNMFQYCELDYEEDFVRREPGDRFVPIEPIPAATAMVIGQTEKICGRITRTVCGDGAGDSGTRAFVDYCLGEIVNNLSQHSGSSGFVTAQYYQRSEVVQVCVADDGIGVRSSLSRVHRVEDDVAALELAIRPNVSGVPPDLGPYGFHGNSGNGLFFLVQLCNEVQGEFVLYSGGAIIERGIYGRPASARPVANWPGTLVYFSIGRDVVDFEGMMDRIREQRFGARSEGLRFE